jgi:hypothetical protein
MDYFKVKEEEDFKINIKTDSLGVHKNNNNNSNNSNNTNVNPFIFNDDDKLKFKLEESNPSSSSSSSSSFSDPFKKPINNPYVDLTDDVPELKESVVSDDVIDQDDNNINDNDDGTGVADPPYRFDNQYSGKPLILILRNQEDMALYRFLKQIQVQVGQSFPMYTIFNFANFRLYCEKRKATLSSSSNNSNNNNNNNNSQIPIPVFEIEMHGFLNLINYCIERTLVAVRQFPLFRNATFMEILQDEQASDAFASLVMDLWKDCIIESCQRYQGSYTTKLSDCISVTQHLLYFSNRTTQLKNSLAFPKIEKHIYPLPNLAMKALSKLGGTINSSSLGVPLDRFFTPERPYLFFLRLCLQAMSLHGEQELKKVLDSIQHPIHSPHDITVQALRNVVFESVAAQGYKDALLSVTTDNAHFFMWMGDGIARIVLFAQLVATCTNLQRISKNKEFARQFVIDRLLSMKLKLTEYIVTMYK